MIYAVVVEPDGQARSLDHQPRLAEKQKLVSGGRPHSLIQYVEVTDGQVVINEEGKVFGMELNTIATALWYDHFGRVVPDVLVGPVVIIGPDDGHGRDTPITPKMLAYLADECGLTFT